MMEVETSDIVLFFGRFHPLILHLPIGFLTIAFLLEVCSRSPRFAHYKPAVGIILLLGAGSAAVAAIFGLMLAESGGYNDDLLFVHQWSGLAVAVLGSMAFGIHRQLKRKPSAALDKSYITVMSLMIISLAVAGHFGGSLTHGSDYLTKYMPDGLRKIAGLPSKEKKEVKKITNLDEAIVYNDIIFPILDNYCTSCHNDDKRKGELMMHTPAALMRGGENGPLFVPGNPAESHMIQKIQLPENHDDHMPPKGKPQLTDDQIELLVWWVNEGAPFDKKVAEVSVSSEVQSILRTLVDPDANKSPAEILLSSAVAPVNEGVLQQLQQRGIMVSTLSDSIRWLQADVAYDQGGDSIVHALAGVSQQLTWLNLRGTSTTDRSLPVINTFKNLTRLDLGKTTITDEGLKHLQELPHLELLNVYETSVSDTGIQHLASLKNLRKLYVWKTNVTREGASQLEKALPGLEVVLGLEVSNRE
jgi:uncharacterized membrane protein